MPLLLGAAGQADQPDVTVRRLLDLIGQIARRSVYLALLVENPLALSQLVRLSSASSWISHFLKQYPLLLDELLDPRSLYAPPDQPELVAELGRRLAGVTQEDQELAMDNLRQFKHANVLRVAAADIVGALPLMKVSDHLTWIAETVLDEALEQAWQHLTTRHGRPPMSGEGKGFAIIGYGKLGGIELGYGSDLDLVFLHGVESANESTDGPAAPLALPVFYARLGQRLIHVLTAYTPAGLLYEIDMRLRPDGASGMLVSSLTSYEAYQRDKAWLWEHQALVRARPVAGDRAIGERFQVIRRAILGLPRDKNELRQGILDMRRRMREELDRSTAEQFDLKQSPGGIVDIEFMVQYGVLAHAHTHPALLDYTDNIRLLAALGDAGLMPQEDVTQLSDAYRQYRCEVHRRALQEQAGTIEASRLVDERQQVQAIWQRWLEVEGG
jgi:glutamate-ammonia-ligase adenylyltransferase